MNFKKAFIVVALVTGCLSRGADGTGRLMVREIIAPTAERSLRITMTVFDAGECELRIVDNAGPNDTSRFLRVADATSELGAMAGCNGGFFTRQPFAPFGLMIAGGTRAGSFDPKSWMKGLIVVRNGKLGFESAESFQDTPNVTQALQSGPWLVRTGQPEPIANDPRIARRTFVCHDGDRWALGISEPCTLAELAAALCSEPVKTVLKVSEALNLDGGPSTGLWVKGDTQVFSSPERWPVRNYVAVFRRER